MLEKFLNKTKFDSYEDFMQNFKVNVPENFNFGYDVVDEWARTNPDKPALLWTNEQGEKIQFTFADIKRESDKAASFFTSLGIGRGDMVMLILKRRYQFWFSIIALHKIGATTIPATHLLTAKDIVYRCQSADIKAIVAVGDDIVLKHIDDALPKCPSLKYRISTGPHIPEGWLDFNKGCAEAAPFVRPAEANSNDDISLMYFTSGTTGEPKMVAHSFTYPLGHIITGSYWHNLHEDSLHLTLADTGWGKALWGKIYGQWLGGSAVFTYDFEKFHAEDILHKMEQYHVTTFCAPPTMYRYMIKEDLSKYDLSSLQHCTTAGEALNPEVYNQWLRQTGHKIFEGFGQTETTLCCLTAFPWMQPRLGSMGLPAPGWRLVICDANDEEVPAGVTGEICVRTDGGKPFGLFGGYFRDEALTKKAWHDDLYHTGDTAYKDELGFLWYVGRVDDVIKSSGYRIGPFEVESALMEHPSVLECAVTGVPDPDRGFVVKATIVLARGYEGTPELTKELQNHVKKVTAPYKYPRIVEYVDELPKTISGKIRRVEIRKNDLEKHKADKPK